MQLFYSNAIEGNLITLSEQESSHCTRVLRMKADDEIRVTDGKGHIYTGNIELAHDKKTSIQVISSDTVDPLPYQLHLYVALTKHSDRLEWMLEKAVELGIASFTPLITHRTERKHIRVDRLESTVLSAMKQSLNAWLPTVNEPVKFSEIISSALSGVKLIAHCNEAPRKVLTEIDLPVVTHIFIGPEGDFTMEEVDLAVKEGAQGISLGNSRLRTETAGLAVVNWMYWINTKTQE
jgi:16S rRNA (uracil1498-N3)-methyltransferase